MRYLVLIVIGLLSACGGDDADYESCYSDRYGTVCCRTYCNSDGTKCDTYCS